MRSKLDDPAYWAGLYRRPTEAGSVELAVEGLVLEPADLVAEIPPEATGEAPVASAKLEELIELLVREKVEALLASGELVAAGASPAIASGTQPLPAPKAAKPRPAAPKPPLAAKPPSPPPAASTPPRAAAPRPEAPGPADARAQGADLTPLLSRKPRLPGGASSLMSAEGLSQDATMLLVMVDGKTPLRSLRTLAPHLDQERFVAIIRDAMRRGLLVLE